MNTQFLQRASWASSPFLGANVFVVDEYNVLGAWTGAGYGPVSGVKSITAAEAASPTAAHLSIANRLVTWVDENGVAYRSNATASAAGTRFMQVVPKDVNTPKRSLAGTPICDWQTATGALTLSAGTAAAAAVDTSVTLFGKPTLKCTFSSAASDTYIATFTPTNPLRLRDIKTIQVPILFTSNASGNGNVGSGVAPFQVWIGTSNSKSIRLMCYFSNLQAGAWTTLSFGRTSQSVSNHAISEMDAAGVTVTTIKIVQATNNTAANSNPVWVGEIRADTAAPKGRVSIVMDGEYSSQYSILFPMLKALGLRTSLALTHADIGAPGRMTEAQIDEMYSAGHECIHHTYDSTKTSGYGGGASSATDWPTAADIGEDIRATWDYFRTKGWTRGIGYGVWGYNYGFNGTQTQVRQNLVAAGLRAGGLQAIRKSAPYNGTLAGDLIPLRGVPVDPFVLTGASQITNTTTPAEVQSMVDQAEATAQWAIVTIHRAVASAPSSLEMTTADFQTWLTYLAGRVAAGGVVCAPFGETFDELMLA